MDFGLSIVGLGMVGKELKVFKWGGIGLNLFLFRIRMWSVDYIWGREFGDRVIN